MAAFQAATIARDAGAIKKLALIHYSPRYTDHDLKILLDETGATTVIFDEELEPRHQRELEAELGSKIKVLDRTALILDIFAQHAHTREGMLQVELAQLKYRLPRLTRAWSHLARQGGGGGGRAGSVGGVGLRRTG